MAAAEHAHGSATHRSETVYERRRPELTVLHRVVREHLESFLADARERLGTGYPPFVENGFRRFLDCGLLCHGFARVRCQSCGHDRLVAFSCKGRAVCPSCAGRRMSDTAAFLADHVLPVVPYRQWTFSAPRWLRPRMVRDGGVLSRVLGVFLGAVFAWQRRRGRERGLEDPVLGSVTFVQRFGSALNLHLHYHAIVPDGVFVHADGGEPGALSFVELPPPTDLDVAHLTDRLARRLTALFSEPDERPLRDEEEALAASWAESLKRARREGEPDPDDSAAPGSLCSLIEGFSLHAATHVAADDRQGLERLLRYGARPGFSQKRLSLREDGRVVYRFRKPWHTGQTELVMEPIQFLRRMAAILPPPRQNQVRFHGIFASRARSRAGLVALLPPREAPAPTPSPPDASAGSPTPRPRRLLWSQLLRRVFAHDVLVCPRCEGPMRLIAVLTDPEIVLGILRHLGLPTEPPVAAPARAPPQADLFEQPS